MNQNQKNALKELYNNLIRAFDVQDLGDCADKLQDILKTERDYLKSLPKGEVYLKEANESQKAIDKLEKADAAIFDVLNEFEEYEIGGAFAAMVGNNSELRALFKENVQFASVCIDEILKGI